MCNIEMASTGRITVTDMIKTVHSPEFWIEQWNESLTGDTSKVSRGYASGEFWNTRAGDYDRDFDDEARRKTDAFIVRLEREGVFEPGMRVLDIGCGPGQFSAAFARRGARVTALDISETMIEKARSNSPPEGEVTALLEDWRDTDIAEKGWEGAFDLVFGRMTPALNTPEAFDRMIRASRRSCYFRAWAEKKASPTVQALWKILTGEDLTDRYSQFRYVFNLLLARGQHPSVWFEEIIIDRSVPVADAILSQTTYFRNIFGDTIDGLDEKIAAYVTSQAVDGVIDETIRGWAGNLAWTI